jgi:hypothetical protein
MAAPIGFHALACVPSIRRIAGASQSRIGSGVEVGRDTARDVAGLPLRAREPDAAAGPHPGDGDRQKHDRSACVGLREPTRRAAITRVVE